MKVKAICIENKEHTMGITYGSLTIGKVYTIQMPEWVDEKDAEKIRQKPISYYTPQCGVMGDNGKELLVPQDFFKLIDEYRNEQINQLLK